MSIESAQLRLQNELRDMPDYSMGRIIATHLIETMNDELALLVDRPNYTIKHMENYVISRAREALKNRNGGLEEKVVYGFATDYYHTDGISITSEHHAKKKAPTVTTHTIKQKVADKTKVDTRQISIFDFGGENNG